MIPLPARPRILVLALRRLGDVLLSTALIRSLRRGFPACKIDALVFDGTEGILAGNPDIDCILLLPQTAKLSDTARMVWRIWRRYDLAVSTQTGDRPVALAFAAAPRRAGPIDDADPSGDWKRRILQVAVPAEEMTHRVEWLLRLADALGVKRAPDLVTPQGGEDIAIAEPYAVIHAAPMFRYKQWTAAGWRELCRKLLAQGLAVITTGGPDENERRYLDTVWNAEAEVRRLDGGTDWPQLSRLIAGARLYVGPDTSVTHLAAATGCPTVAIYGPTDPRPWGPWPCGGLAVAWDAAAAVQRRGNVWLVQNPLPCTPCQLEGCERRRDSFSACLDELRAQSVFDAIDEALVVKPASVDTTPERSVG